jgi:hypothetical protein
MVFCGNRVTETLGTVAMRHKKEFCAPHALSRPYRIRLFPHQSEAWEQLNRLERRRMSALIRAAFDTALKKVKAA